MPSITALIFITIFFTGSVATLFKTPFYGILLYEFVYFMNPVARWWYRDLPDLRFSFTIGIVLIIGYLLRSQQFRENKIFDTPQFKWLAAMTLIVILAFSWAVRIEIHEILLIRYIKFILFAVLFYKIVDSAEKLEKTLGVYLFGIFYFSWYGWQLGRTGEGRLEGIGGPDCLLSNETATVVVTAVPLLIFYILYGKKRWIQGSAAVGMVFVLNLLILLNSRGSMVALSVAVPYFLFFILKENPDYMTRLKVGTGVLLCFAAFIYLTDATFWSRMETLYSDDPSVSSNKRTDYWLKTFDMLADHPLGMGGRGYEFMSPDYLPSEWLTQGYRAVHSLWFEVLSEYGFQGLAVFSGFLASNFLIMRRVRHYLKEQDDYYHQLQSVTLEASFIAFLGAATFGNSFYREILYWLTAFMAAFANIHMIKPLKTKMTETEKQIQ